MARKPKNFQHELKKIALHFSIDISHMLILRKQAAALDEASRKLILLEGHQQLHYRIVDLSNFTCYSVKAVHKKIDAGATGNKNADEFVEKISLTLHHGDESKSIDLVFFDAAENTPAELPDLRYKLDRWHDILAGLIHTRFANRA